MFSRNYIKCFQDKFEFALKDGELESAVSILESLPLGSTPEEKITRLVVVNEGYKAIINRYIGTIPKEERRHDKIIERLKELREYRDLGTRDQVGAALDELERFQNALQTL